MLKDYLAETYGYNEPIFINEISLNNVTDNALRQSFKRMIKSGDIMRFDTGIYYLPKASRLLKNSYLDPLKVIVRKYVQNGSDIFGYLSGAAFANQLGLTTQIPAVIEIVTNKEATKGRTAIIGNQKIRLKRTALPITKENAALLQFLDMVSQLEKYSELSLAESKQTLLTYARTKKFSRSQLAAVTPALTGMTAKKLIDWGIIYEFTSE